MQTLDLDSWHDLKLQVQQLRAARGDYDEVWPLLYRGQANAEWSLETSLDRTKADVKTFDDYYQFVSAAKPVVESITGRVWPEIDFNEIDRVFNSSRSFMPIDPFTMPAYELLVHFRHHGFPSPLLDWSRSLYIAAFFAFESCESGRAAIYVYQEAGGSSKTSTASRPGIYRMGPRVRTHPRHVLQQAEYTLASKRLSTGWRIISHEAVFKLQRKRQDLLWKLTVPSSQADAVLLELDEMNINAYSLFQSEDALLRTVAFRSGLTRRGDA